MNDRNDRTPIQILADNEADFCHTYKGYLLCNYGCVIDKG